MSDQSPEFFNSLELAKGLRRLADKIERVGVDGIKIDVSTPVREIKGTELREYEHTGDFRMSLRFKWKPENGTREEAEISG